MSVFSVRAILHSLVFFILCVSIEAKSQALVSVEVLEVIEVHDDLSASIDELNQKMNDHIDGKSSASRREIAELKNQIFQLTMDRAIENRKIEVFATSHSKDLILISKKSTHHSLTLHRIFTYLMARFLKEARMSDLHVLLKNFGYYLLEKSPDAILMKAPFLRIYSFIYEYEIDHRVVESLLQAIDGYLIGEQEWIQEHEGGESKTKHVWAIQRKRALVGLKETREEIKAHLEFQTPEGLQKKLNEIWGYMDVNKNGWTNLLEIVEMAQNMTPLKGQKLLNENHWIVKNFFGLEPVFKKDLSTIFKLRAFGTSVLDAMDFDSNRRISKTEFFEFYENSLFIRNENKVSSWIHFEDIDLNKDGDIQRSELNKVISTFGDLPNQMRKQIQRRFQGAASSAN